MNENSSSTNPLATYIELEEIYNVFYRIFSMDVHGGDLYNLLEDNGRSNIESSTKLLLKLSDSITRQLKESNFLKII